MATDWTPGAIIRVRCTNEGCKKGGVTQVIRPLRYGDVYLMGGLRCAKCLGEVEIVSKVIRGQG